MAPPRKHLPPNGREIIAKAASNGLGEKMLADALGLSLTVWKRMRKDNPEVREIWEEARAIEEQKLVGLLMQAAEGAPAQYDANGRQIRAEREPYPGAAMFLLKSRHGYRDNGPAEGAVDTGPRVIIQLPAAMSPDEWDRRVTIEGKAT